MIRLYNPQWQYLPFHQNPWFQAAVACALAVAMGIAALLVDPLAGFGIVFGAAGAIILLKRPELAVIFAFIASSTLFNAATHTSIARLADGMLLLALGMIVVRWMLEQHFTFVPTPINFALIGFLGMAGISGLLNYLGSVLNLAAFVPEFRNWCYYAIFFIMVNLVRQKHQLMLILKLLLVITLICAGLMIAQYALGSSVNLLMTGRVEALITQDTKYDTVTRILPPAQSSVFMGFLILMVILIVRPFTRWSLVLLVFWFMCAGAVIVTFNRNFWVSAMLIMAMTGVLCFWYNRPAFGRVLLICGIGISVLTAIPLLMPGSAAAGLIQASAERIGSIASSEQVENDESLRWRDTEYEYAVPALLANPIIGVGPGNAYRPFDSRLDTVGHFSGMRYMHNGHLWLMVKGGIISYIFFAIAIVLTIYRGVRFWRFVPDLTLRSVALANALTLLVLPIQAIVAPIYMQVFWIPILGIMMGTNEVIYRLSGLTR